MIRRAWARDPDVYLAAKTFVLILSGLAVAYLALLVVLPFTTFSLREMDWNDDGRTSLSEVLRGDDVGRRHAADEPAGCTEYFDLKTGLAVKVRCPGLVEARRGRGAG